MKIAPISLGGESIVYWAKMSNATGISYGLLFSRVASAEEMQQIDREAQERFCIPSLLLMEEAGLLAWIALKKRLIGGEKSIVFLVGGGNNGGDAAVMARFCSMQSGMRPTILLASGNYNRQVGQHIDICRCLDIPVIEWNVSRAIPPCDWIVDGLLGCGISGRARPVAEEIISAVNGSDASVCSVDLPSGLGDRWSKGDPAIQSTITISIGLAKRCCYYPSARGLCGDIEVISIGFPRALVDDDAIMGQMLEPANLEALLPETAIDSHKYQRGVVECYAGSQSASGAALLAAKSALSAGAGLARLYVDRAIWSALASQSPSIMTIPLEDVEAPLQARARQSLLIGPGWGSSEGRRALFEALMRSGIPSVVDADGLALLGKSALSREHMPRELVLTPHWGEFRRLLASLPSSIVLDIDSDDNPLPAAFAIARHWSATVLLKGNVSWVVSPSGRYWIYDGNIPALATAGSGDTLAGIVAALLARGLSADRAASLAALIHGEAGRKAASAIGWFSAENLTPFIASIAYPRNALEL